MRHTFVRLASTLLLGAALAMFSTLAYAQGGGTTTSLAGTVVDSSGGVIPGADVLAKDNATATEYRTVTDSNGRFSIPSITPGTYTVTISLMGFKTVQLPDVQVTAATPASVRATLEVGNLEETVIVQGATELVQTQTASVQTTIVVQQIQQLPLVTRTALDFVTALAGVQTVGGSRSSIINGLPGVTMNITLDGVNVQDNNNRGNAGGQYGGDGFFMYIRPMLDSVEEITVSTSTPGAESAGQGATQVRFVTRSGSNTFTGSAYNAWRNQAGVSEDDVATRNKKRGFLWRLNTPYWFNKRDRPKTAAGDYFIDDVRLQTPGFRVGGPIKKDKLFFFFNSEWFLWPNQIGRNRYILTESAQQGIFSYPAADGSGTRTINLLELASEKGQVSTMDPTTQKLLGDIRSAASGDVGGGIANWDLNLDRFSYSPGGDQWRWFPTVRLDYNLTNNHRLSFSTRYNRFKSDPDILNGLEPRYPGFANTAGQYSHRYMWQATFRSTIGRSLVNEARWGYSGGRNHFYPELSTSQFDCTGLGCQGGYNLNFNLNVGTNQLTTATASNGPSSRLVPDYVYEDTLTWLKGKHSVSMGASFTQIKFENWGMPGGVVPTIAFGVNSQDPAYSMFAPASGNFPGGINDTYAGYARNLYAILTGRVTQVTGTAVLGSDGQYHYQGDRWQKGGMDELGVFISDSWRVRPNVTLTGGLRWEMQFPFKAETASYARLEQWTDVYGVSGEGNLFKPGTMTGRKPVFVPFKPGDHAYDTDWNNVAPSFGLTWRPHISNGILGTILSSEPVFRGGYSVAYTRYGTGDFTGVYGANPGATRSATRSITSGIPFLGYDGLPVLLRDRSRLGASEFPDAPTYPFSPLPNETVAVMDPNLRVPFTHQYSIGWQREIGKSIGLEVRYVGNRFNGQWTTANLNAAANRNLLENGFLEEFKLAQRNLQANIAAGLGNTFAYTGAPGTAPLPIFLAHFAGIPLNDARNRDPGNYKSSNFKSSSWYNPLALYDPDIAATTGTGSSGLQNANFRNNMLAAGLPLNFWVVNPDVYQANANLLYNGGSTRYDGLQLDMRRRLSNGLLVQGSYVLGRSMTWQRPTMRESYTVQGATMDGPFVTQLSTWGVDHSFKLNWVYELPFGRGKTWGADAGRWKNALIGGWEWDGTMRLQSGQILNLGNYRLVGMTDKDLQNMFKLRKVTDADGKTRLYMLPEDVIKNSIIALYNASATSSTGYSGPAPTGKYIAPAEGPDCVQAYNGQCAPLNHFVRGPRFTRFDFSFVKRIEVGARRRIELRMDLFNVFDHVNFTPRFGLGSTMSGWELTGAAQDINASQDAGGRITQFGLRFTW